MRERLMQLIKQAHTDYLLNDNYTDSIYEFIADRLIENGAILPLVKVGQTVWSVMNGYDYVVEGKIHEYVSRGDDVDSIYFSRNGYLVGCTVEDAIGKTVFLTREAAEAALKARGQNGK